MGHDTDRNERNADFLYSLACELLACHLTVYYVLDHILVEEARARVMIWLPQASRLVTWLQADKNRTRVLINLHFVSEPVLDAYLEESTTMVENEATHLFEKWKGIEWNMWFYYLYCRWFLRILKKFDRLVRSEPVAFSSNLQAYTVNLGLFQALSEILEQEHPDFDSMGIDSQTRGELENIMNTTIERLTQLWLQTLHSAHQSVQ